MYYATIAAVALLVNLILNWDVFTALLSKKDFGENKSQVNIRYGMFLMAANCFFLTEISWGLLYGHHSIPELFPLIYSTTISYFLFILLTMLTWARYIVAYTDKTGFRSIILTHGVWIVFMIGIICLILNRFFPFIFSFNDAYEYIPESGRNTTFLLMLAFYVSISVYMFRIAKKSTGDLSIRYFAVSCTSIILGVSMLLQIIFSFFPIYVIGLLTSACVVHSFIEAREKRDKKMQYYIASAMVKDYEAIYYITVETGEFLEFSRSERFDSMGVPVEGRNFYEETLENIEKVVFPDDKEYARDFFSKEAMLKNLEDKRSFSFKYRVMIDDNPRFYLFTYMYADNDQHMILYVKDIEDELSTEKKLKESEKISVTFSQIAESLATNYDVVYYIDIKDASYVSYEFNNIYGQLQPAKTGPDFYQECHKNIPKIVHPQDLNLVLEFTTKDYLISALEDRKSYSIDYRIVIDGKSRFTRMIARKTADNTHIIICVENVDFEVRKEKEHLQALKTEKELARRDELTGVKNKTAYLELGSSVQSNMDNGLDYLPYALIVCDCNDLKKINDSQGHAAGDEYIRSAAKLLCNLFVHSPVFRIGGDEFVVFLRADDYSVRYDLFEKLQEQVLNNKRTGKGAVIASGMAEYDHGTDTLFTDVFERADKVMYENKQKLKM
ncbi:MAG: diguanylate cyclase [Butyrivibrio sp.]|nr:diguanylate cyclase [Butyrivibrio sp.]